jgi:hypothetical protein
MSVDTQARLGSAGIAEVTASLWRVDCQSCGLPLGAGPAALAVDQAGPVGWASLHHERCRQPQWNDSGMIAVNAAHQTHRSRLVIMPVHGLHLPAGRDQVLPVMIVNPALECVQLRQAGGRWQPQLDEDFTAAGMTLPGSGLVIHQPIPGASAVLTAVSAAVRLRARPGITYESWLDGQDHHTALARRAITSQGGIMLAVSHAVDPAATGDLPRQFDDGLREGKVLLGWAALDA